MAISSCVRAKEGAQLAVIKNDSNYEAISKMFPKENFWLGGSNVGNDGNWIWIDEKVKSRRISSLNGVSHYELWHVNW